jgi:hypothetical protein
LFVLRALLIRATIFLLVTLLCAVGAPAENPVAGRWTGRSPDPVGRSEDIELRFSVDDAGLTGVLHVADRDIPLTKIRLQGRNLTFDASRELRGHNILYHYDGTLSGETLDFTVQNDDGSSFFRFVARHAQ